MVLAALLVRATQRIEAQEEREIRVFGDSVKPSAKKQTYKHFVEIEYMRGRKRGTRGKQRPYKAKRIEYCSLMETATRLMSDPTFKFSDSELADVYRELMAQHKREGCELGLCFLEDNSYAEFDEGCAVNITTAASFFDIRGNSYFKDSSDNVWTITGAPSGIILANGSQVESGATVNATDPLIKFITYFAEPNSRYAEDNRYTEKYCFTMMGTLPPGFSLNYIYEGGVTGTEVPLYIAKGLANIVAMRVYTRVANGAAHTDTYQIYVNGAAPAIPFGVTITNGNSGSYNVGTVPLVADDRVSVVFTSDPATTAQDITIEFDVRILE